MGSTCWTNAWGNASLKAEPGHDGSGVWGAIFVVCQFVALSMILPPGHLWKQLQRRQQEAERLRAEAAARVVTIDVGGGLVRVTVGGDLRVRHIVIAPQALQSREELEDLLVTGINRALDAAADMVRNMLQPLEHLYPGATEQLPR